MPTSTLEAIKSEAPTIAEIRSQYGVGDLRKAIVKQLMSLNAYLHFDNPLSTMEMLDTADIVMQKYYYLKPADIALVLQRGRTGQYGKMFNRISAQDVIGWFATYVDERFAEAERDTLNRHAEIKSHLERAK